MNFLIPDNRKKTYAVYVRAFSGKHSRFPEFVLKENSEMIRYDLPGHSFMADAGEWVVVDGRIGKGGFQNPGCYARIICYDRFVLRGRPVVCFK